MRIFFFFIVRFKHFIHISAGYRVVLITGPLPPGFTKYQALELLLRKYMGE